MTDATPPLLPNALEALAGARVLIVDGSLSTRAYTGRILQEAGCSVTPAKDKADVLNLLEKKEFDAVLMRADAGIIDHRSGCSDLLAIRRKIAARAIPSVVSAGCQNEERTRDIGASAVVLMPFNPQELLNAMDKALRESRLPRGSVSAQAS